MRQRALGSARALHHGAGRVAGHEIDQDHFAAQRLDDGVADHVLALVVAALDQHRRLDARDQFFRRVLVEHDDEIDRLERGQHLGARLHRLHRAARAFKPGDRGIAVQAHHQPVAGRARAGQQFDVAGMQKIEAAIGEADAQALPPPFGQMLVEQRPVEHDLFLGRERRRRQDARAQFGDRQRRGAAFADHHRRGRVGGAHGRFEIGLHGEHGRQHRDHRVAGAGDIAHAHRIGRHMDRRRPRPPASCRLRCASPEPPCAPSARPSSGRRGRDLIVGLRRAVGRIGQFLPVRRDQGRAAV